MTDADASAAYTVAHIQELPFEIDDDYPTTEWKPIRRCFGIGSFGCNAAVAREAGDVLTHDHDETSVGHEELFLIVSGHATYRVAGEEIDAPAGTFLYVRDPAVVRGVVAREPGTTMFVIGAQPGVAFAPSEWDTEPLPE
jgi:hypothetical protein